MASALQQVGIVTGTVYGLSDWHLCIAHPSCIAHKLLEKLGYFEVYLYNWLKGGKTG